jgi:hypothetical protein
LEDEEDNLEDENPFDMRNTLLKEKKNDTNKPNLFFKPRENNNIVTKEPTCTTDKK